MPASALGRGDAHAHRIQHLTPAPSRPTPSSCYLQVRVFTPNLVLVNLLPVIPADAADAVGRLRLVPLNQLAAVQAFMHARELAELAATIVTQADLLIRTNHRLSPSGLEMYWTASKCRVERWMQGIREFDAVDTWGEKTTNTSELWQTGYPLIEEILLSELLTRVWAAMVICIDAALGTAEGEPFVRSVLMSHLEARYRILQLLVRHSENLSCEDAQRLNRLRSRAERWNDTLLGGLMRQRDVREFSFDPLRTEEFSHDYRADTHRPDRSQVWPVIVSALRASLLLDSTQQSPNADLNEKIAAGILSGFGPDVFDSVGKFRSLWEIRLAHAAKDTQGMIDQLMVEEQGRSSTRPIPWSSDGGDTGRCSTD